MCPPFQPWQPRERFMVQRNRSFMPPKRPFLRGGQPAPPLLTRAQIVRRGEIDAAVVGVVSNRPDAYALARAAQAGIGTELVTRLDGEERRRYDTRLAGAVASFEPDWVVLAGWMRILTMSFLGWFPQRVVNLHPALPGELPGTGAIEAPFIFRKGDWYYQFVSFDLCCRKMNSTYKIMVGRSKSVTGPYFDKEGISMLDGGGSLVLAGNENWVALGHNSAYTFDGQDYLVFHAYETADNALQKLRILPIRWEDGWPVVNPADLDLRRTNLIETPD